MGTHITPCMCFSCREDRCTRAVVSRIEGKSIPSIADELNVSAATIWRYLEERDIPLPKSIKGKNGKVYTGRVGRPRSNDRFRFDGAK